MSDELEPPPPPGQHRGAPIDRERAARRAVELADRLEELVDEFGGAVYELAAIEYVPPPRDYFAIPEVVAYRARDALAAAIGWLDEPNGPAHSITRRDELRGALEALSRHANPGARRYPAPEDK